MTDTELRLLKSLSQRYPTIQKASTEIINLSAILNLPKGTEHFISDIHGEYEAFTHILNNASGVIKRKINDVFKDSLRQSEKSQLATLIYYPKEKLRYILRTEENPKEWYKITLHRLIEVCRNASGKYTRSKVRKMLPADFAYVIEELLHEHDLDVNKSEYYNSIINAIIETGRADAFIYEICVLIRRLTIDRLHIVGDIYDRGPSPDVVIDTLMQYQDVDIQWGNHDVVWMGAALGSKACIASVIRMAARYDNLAIIEDNYGINLLPLATFAIETYGSEECLPFKPKVQTNYSESQEMLVRRMHKAISIIQFKLDGQIIDNNPLFDMEHVKRMHRIDKEKGTVEIDGEIYPLKDTSFPTLDPKNPYKLTEEETTVIDRLQSAFLTSEKLRKHIQYLFDKGSMYLTYNSNLLVHGCIPLNEDGSLKEVKVLDKKLKGKALFDELEKIMRRAMANANQGLPNSYELDYFWYLWQGPDSPLFGKRKMATFEMYLVEDKKTHRGIVEQACIRANNNTINIIKHTDRGRDFEKLKEINRTYLQKTGIDNISLFARKYKEVVLDNETSADSDYNIGTALLLKKDYIGAILHLTKALETSTNNSQKRDIYYNRAVAFIELNDIPKAKRDLQNAINLGDVESQKLLDKIEDR
jgi:fructose-1,6-bisphosphatase-3